MTDLVTIDNGNVRPLWAVQAVDALLQKLNTRPIWEVVDFVLRIFQERYPDFDAKKNQAPAKNKYGANETLEFRKLLSIPPEIKDTLELVLADRIQDYGEQKFWRDFAKKYPAFRFAEKI